LDIQQINHNLFFLSNKHSTLNAEFLTLTYDLNHSVYQNDNMRIKYYSMRNDLEQLKKHITALRDKRKVLEEAILKAQNTIVSII